MADSIRDSIRAYYDYNTRLFLRFGSSRQAQAIHRALWPPGVASLPQALNVSNEMLLSVARATESRLIADLGCGVGATLFYLLENLPNTRGLGLTLSPLQARLGTRHAPPNARLLEADFQRLPLPSGFDLAYSIEAFVHATRPEEYLAESARILRVGGQLALIDDFLARQGIAPSHQAWRQVYQRGWHAPNLCLASELQSLAAQHGLRLLEDRDLTPLLRLRALPDLLAKIFLTVFTPFWKAHPIFPAMLGSMALQQCLRDGMITYRWLLFEKGRVEAP
jgi:SAM-dependent methyltransferase